MWTLYNLSIKGQWANNYGWEYFGCSSNCLIPDVTIFTKMQFSGKHINIFTIFFSIYFWGINHTMITNFWHNRKKLTQLFCVVKKMAHKSHWLCVKKVHCPVAPLNFFHFFHILQVWFYYKSEQNEGVSCRKLPRTSHSFNENQPMHRKRNFLKIFVTKSDENHTMSLFNPILDIPERS